MVFLITLICAIAFAFAFKTPLRKAPWVFYTIAILLDILFIGRSYLDFPVYVERPIFYLVQKCTLAEALFVIVMYIGVFSEKSKIRVRLMPVRAELSILACLLALGHIVNYLMSFMPLVFGSTASLRVNIISSFCLAILLVVLLVLLGVTSFNAVKKRINAQGWKRIQWFAYPFFLLTWVHVLLFLLPSALSGRQPAIISVGVYSVVFVVYIIARSAAALRKRSLS
jgi:DMSO/TMAO reductase YedYZ heme-binding membrane subunit